MATQERQQYGKGSETQSANSNGERIANGLGWFSIGLGLAEVIMPGKMAQLIGVEDEDSTRNTLRLYGLREIAAGVGILSRPQAAGWMWSRVAGDLLDLSSLGKALSSGSTNRTRAVAATAAVLGVTALDIFCAQQLSGSGQEEDEAESDARRTIKTIIINRSAEDLYGFWHQFSNLPTFMSQLESVEELGEARSHWKAKGPAGKTVEWDAEIVDDQPNSYIAWRSLEGADVDHSGSVRFERAPGGRGTLVRVELEYAPPGGAIGTTIAKLFRSEPGQQVEDSLRAFKQVMETGEVVRSDASIHKGMHAAQPPKTFSASA